MLSDPWAITMHYSFRFVLAVLAVWRITHLLSREDGPWHLLRRIRKNLEQGILERLVSCFYCLSVWVSLPFALFVGGSLLEMLVGWWAISGAAVLLERATQDPFELKLGEDDSGLLRSEKADNQREGH